jgi:endonuclease/exonuclease/phosphatase family metal-dependent hydrolase
VTHIRLLSCNLYNGRADPTALADVLSSTAPDVVAAQELAPNAAGVLHNALPYGRLEPSINYRGTGIALRYPAEVTPFDLPHRDGLIATLDPAAWPALGSALQIVNLHLANPIDRPLAATRRTRRDQVAAVVRHVARTSSPLTIVGDFNATPAWPAYRRLIRVLRDGVHDTGSTHRTWGPTWWSPRLLRIDHALVRGGVRVTNARTVRIRGADHSGLLVDLEVE